VRQALPPLFVAGVVGLAVLALFFPLAGWALAATLSFYLLVLAVGAIPAAIQKKDGLLVVGIPLAIACMHFPWGAGFWVSMVKSAFNRQLLVAKDGSKK
jgi:succinoglycan biosynthesis protein ExoA